MIDTPAGLLKKLKGFDLNKSAVSFWLVKRRTAYREATYSVLRVDIDEKLLSRLRRCIRRLFRDASPYQGAE